jgi:Ti-type conjugative transfer relaxase TraA
MQTADCGHEVARRGSRFYLNPGERRSAARVGTRRIQMAIGYINVSIVSAGRGESAVGLGAYIARADWRNPLTGRRHEFGIGTDDLAAPVTVLLPQGADPKLRDPKTLWVAAERAEVTLDRGTGLPRFKKNAALAKHIVLALPKELTDAEREELALEWARSQYPGVGVMLAIHKPDDPDFGNWHAHLMVTTRMVGPEGFGKKARDLDPRFAGVEGQRWSYIEAQDLPGLYRAFQNEFFRKKGIPLSVDPAQSGGGVHWGCGRFMSRKSDREPQDHEARAAARARMLGPAEVVKEATKNRPTFSRRSLQALLRAHRIQGQEAADILDRIFADGGTLALHDPETGEALDLYTTREVWDQEGRILEAADSLAGRRPSKNRRERLTESASRLAGLMNLTGEQREALIHALDNRSLSLVRGVAGAGKSYTMQAVRQAHEEAGYRVIGLAPTNKVVAKMAADNFTYAATLHSERYRQEKLGQRWRPWNRNTCVIVDEAGMVDSEMLEWLLTTAVETGARVILVGDEAQLASVQRGGMFGVLKGRFGAAELKEIRRQDADWARQASLDLSEGCVSEALAAYAEHDRIHWSIDLESAADALVERWRADLRAEPGLARFVYCATNKVANELNNRLQRACFGRREDFEVFGCDRGWIQLYVDDRVQFHATDRTLEIMNGHVGRVVSIAENEIAVQLDETGKVVRFDPATFTSWGLGYAGTVYRGQGETLPQAYALYDHVRSWSARSTYVALTRHRQSFDLFIPRSLARDLGTLAQQMSRRDGADAAHAYLSTAEAARRFPKILVDAQDDAGNAHRLDAGDARMRDVLQAHWRRVPAPQFCRDYNRLKKAAKEVDPDHPIHRSLSDCLSDALNIARQRGFYPWTGKPDPRCLCDFILGNDGLRRSDNPALAPRKGEIDVRPLVVDIEHLDYNAWFALSRRLRRLDHHVLNAVLRCLDRVTERVEAATRLISDLAVARHIVRLARLIKRNGPDGKLRPVHRREDYLELRGLDPTPRQTRGRFHLHRDDPDDGLVPVDLMGFVTARENKRLASQAKQKTGRYVAALPAQPPAAPQASTATSQPRSPSPAVLDAREQEARAAVLGGVGSGQKRTPSPAQTATPASTPARATPAVTPEGQRPDAAAAPKPPARSHPAPTTPPAMPATAQPGPQHSTPATPKPPASKPRDHGPAL